ncbi:Uncharacterised protein [Vibrio cholerae]|nr:Uncharacterised protein [Vibrio cholerae]CSI58958.1 Uncharacterised protein [Vibrio cholerae]
MNNKVNETVREGMTVNHAQRVSQNVSQTC